MDGIRSDFKITTNDMVPNVGYEAERRRHFTEHGHIEAAVTEGRDHDHGALFLRRQAGETMIDYTMIENLALCDNEAE